MTDAQVLTISLSIVISAVAVIYSNSRVADMKDLVNKWMDDLNRRLDMMELHLKETFRSELKIHELEHHK